MHLSQHRSLVRDLQFAAGSTMARKINAENRRGEAPVHNRNPRALVRSLGLVIVTGAADDDCSAIGTYASAGAQLGTLVTGKRLVSHYPGDGLEWQPSCETKGRKKFYALIASFTGLSVAVNFTGFNPMKALVYSGIVQGVSTPALLLLIMLLTVNRAVMGDNVNSTLNILGWTTAVCHLQR
jgi:Mn2+/Fe2+ NRAMP family transporter